MAGFDPAGVGLLAMILAIAVGSEKTMRSVARG